MVITLGAMALAARIVDWLEPPAEIEAQKQSLEDEKLAIDLTIKEGFKRIEYFGQTARWQTLNNRRDAIDSKLIKLAGKRRWKKPSDSKS